MNKPVGSMLMLLAGLMVAGVQGCASSEGGSAGRAQASSLTNTYWKLIRLDGKPVTPEKDQREAHLIFQEKDNHLAGSGGCNRIMGTYRLEGNSLSFGKVASTMMACPNLNDEQAFLAALAKVKRWKFDGPQLVLLGEAGQPLASFDALALK